MKPQLMILPICLALAMPAMSEDESLKIEGTPPDPVEVAKDAAGPDGLPPDDLLDDEHVKQELAVNKFTAPSISKIFDTLQVLMPLPITEVQRKMPARMSQDRADLAIELGFLIADGFLMVQSKSLDDVEQMAKDLTRYGKALGTTDQVSRHAASLLENAKAGNVDELKRELSATQKDVENELFSLKDADLAHLISLGGWIRALEVATVAVDKQFSPERAGTLMRPDIAEYYSECLTGLPPRVSTRQNYIAMHGLLEGLTAKMTLPDGQEPTPESVKEIRKIAAQLVELALKREQ